MRSIHYTRCPVCESPEIKHVLTVKDFTVSGSQFSIAECSNCTLRFTQDVPNEDSIGPYYKSENYISHTDTSKGLINSLYKTVRKRTLKQKRQLIEKISGLTNGILLDVGAGTGGFLDEMKTGGWRVTGIEPDQDARNLSKSLYGLELKEGPALFALAPASFTIITLWHVLEHVHELHRYVEQLKTLLTPQGRLIIAVPNYKCADARAYGAFWAAYDVPRHLYHFSPESMKALVEKHGLKIIDHRPMWFDSFYVSLLSSKYKNGHTNWIGAVGTGLFSNFRAIGNTKKCSSLIYVIAR